MAHLVHCPAWGVWWRRAADSSRTQACSPLAKRTHQSRAREVSEGSVPLDLALGSPDLPEAERHQAHVDGIGGDANDAEIMEHEEQDPGQVDGAGERYQGAQQQQGRHPAAPEAT